MIFLKIFMAYGGPRKCSKLKLPGRIDPSSKWGQHWKIMKIDL